MIIINLEKRVEVQGGNWLAYSKNKWYPSVSTTEERPQKNMHTPDYRVSKAESVMTVSLMMEYICISW